MGFWPDPVLINDRRALQGAPWKSNLCKGFVEPNTGNGNFIFESAFFKGVH